MARYNAKMPPLRPVTALGGTAPCRRWSCGAGVPLTVGVVLLILSALLLLLPVAVEAQRPPTDRARASMRRVAAPRKQTATTDLGYVSTTGNTNVSTVNAGQRYNLVTGFWRFEEFVQVVYGESEGRVTSSFIRAAVGGEYAVRPSLGVAAGLLFDQNRFSGVRQRSEPYLGLVWRVVEGGRDTLRLDAGGSLTRQRNVDGTIRRFPAARTALWYKRGLAPKAYVTQAVEMVPNLETPEDYRVNAIASLVSPVARSLALRVEYQLRFDNLPEPTFQSTDRIFTTGIQVSF
jgi:putative salt-induced outer membrane protein YdiY